MPTFVQINHETFGILLCVPICDKQSNDLPKEIFAQIRENVSRIELYLRPCELQTSIKRNVITFWQMKLLSTNEQEKVQLIKIWAEGLSCLYLCDESLGWC